MFAILLLCFSWFLPKTGDRDWVANSRAALVYAVADQGVLHIDDYHHATGDKAYYNSHYYSVASIGPSLIAVPAYAAFRALACAPPLAKRLCPSPPFAHDPAYARGALVWVTFFAVSLPSAALGVLVYFLIGEVLGSWRHAFGLALLYGLATVAFPYSRAFYQHQLAAFGLAFGFYLLWRVVHRGAGTDWLWLAGPLFGLSAISEYPLVLPIGVLFAWAFFVMPHRAALYKLVLGALPALLALAAYNLAIFGTPMPVAYRYHVFHSDLHEQGVMGLAWPPSLEAFYGITVSPSRGLYFMSPFLLLMVPGIYLLWRRAPAARALVLAIAGVVASFFVYNSAYLFWSGGYSIGPRYLVPMLPLAMLPVAAGLQGAWRSRTGRVIVALLCAASLINVWAQTIAGQYYPPLSPSGLPQNNLLAHTVPHLLAGDIARNWGHYLGLEGWWSVLPLGAAVGGILAVRARLQRATRVSCARAGESVDTNYT